MSRRNVDGYGRGTVPGGPNGDLPTDLLQNPITDFVDGSSLFSQRNELVTGQQRPFVVPPQERFAAGQSPVTSRHFGLIDKTEFVPVESANERAGHAVARLETVAHLFRIELPAATAEFLGAVHGEVCMAHESASILGVGWKHGDADADRSLLPDFCSIWRPCTFMTWETVNP